MLTCVYHPIDGMQVVEENAAEKMLASGVWFDCPTKAKKYRENVEDEIKNEESAPIKKGKTKSKKG